MKQIFMCKPGAFTPKDKEKISKAGYCVVETSDFECCRVIDPAIPLDRETIFKAAMFAIARSGTTGFQGAKTEFGSRLAELLAKP